MQRNYYESFRCCEVGMALFAKQDTLYVRRPIHKCVRAVYGKTIIYRHKNSDVPMVKLPLLRK